MSNVSDTNEIVAARLLFPLARIFSYWGCTSIRLLDFHQPHDRPHGAPLSAPEMRSQAAERPETMHIGNSG
jgi:hypothetical protein